MKTLLTLLCFMPFILPAQQILDAGSVQPKEAYDNISVKPLFSDSLVSSFMIFIKKEVKAHKHASHSEHVYILEGTGLLTLGSQKQQVKSGDLIFIPKNTVHSLQVTSDIPMKVISTQAPHFDGSDRVMVE